MKRGTLAGFQEHSLPLTSSLLIVKMEIEHGVTLKIVAKVNIV